MPAPLTVALALGSNLGDRLYWLRCAIDQLQRSVRLVRISKVVETAPVDSPPGAGDFLNLVVVGHTRLPAVELLRETRGVEARLGRRRSVPNAPRRIDIDVLFYSGALIRNGDLIVPHPRFREREFVLEPLRDLSIRWIDPLTARSVDSFGKREGAQRSFNLY